MCLIEENKAGVPQGGLKTILFGALTAIAITSPSLIVGLKLSVVITMKH